MDRSISSPLEGTQSFSASVVDHSSAHPHCNIWLRKSLIITWFRSHVEQVRGEKHKKCLVRGVPAPEKPLRLLFQLSFYPQAIIPPFPAPSNKRHRLCSLDTPHSWRNPPHTSEQRGEIHKYMLLQCVHTLLYITSIGAPHTHIYTINTHLHTAPGKKFHRKKTEQP